jgi:PAS domain S-box-containing protein
MPARETRSTDPKTPARHASAVDALRDLDAESLRAEAFLHAAFGIAVVDASEGTVVDANAAYAELLGRAPEDVVGRAVRELYRPADRAILAQAATVADESGSARFEGSLLNPDGSAHPVEVDVRSIRDATGHVRWRVESARSIRGRLLTERENEDLFRRMRLLSRRLESAQESERRQVATMLHEGLMQTLAGLNLALERLKRDLGSTEADREELRTWVDGMQSEVRAATQAARVAASEFLPPGLEHLGLWPVLEKHVAGWEHGHRIAARVDLRATPKLDADVALAGFRAVDECMRNVATHARAQELRVSTLRDGRYVEIHVDDDGIGIGPGDLDKPGALGLLGVTERVLMLGGELHVQRRRPRGTHVTIRLPVARAKRKR